MTEVLDRKTVPSSVVLVSGHILNDNEASVDKVDPLKDFRNQIICGDAVEVMKKMPSNSIDIIVTSPPYNLKNSTGNGMKDGRGGKWANAALQKGYANYDDNMPHEEYVKWQRDCLSEMFRLIPDNGAIFIIINGEFRVVYCRIVLILFRVFQSVKLSFGRDLAALILMRAIFLPTYEVIYLIAKPKFKLAPKANACSDVWEFAQEMKNGHPAPFPVKLIDRIISSTTAKIVLDPFMGSGTTAISAIKNGIDYIGVDMSPEYCDMANKRIKKETKQLRLL